MALTAGPASTPPPAPQAAVETREALRAELPMPELMQFCRDAKIDFKGWVEQPAEATRALARFKAALPAIEHGEVQLLAMQQQVDAFLLRLGTPPSSDQLRGLVDQMAQHDQLMETTQKGKEALKHDVELNAARNGLDRLEDYWNRVSDDPRILTVAAVAGAATLWFAWDRLGKTPAGNVLAWAGATTVGYFGLSKILDVTTGGDMNLGHEYVAKWIGDLAGSTFGDKKPEVVESYAKVYDQLKEERGFSSAWKEEFAGLCDVPMDVLLTQYQQARAAGTPDAMKPSALSSYLRGTNKDQISGRDVYAMVDQMFGGPFTDASGHTYQQGELMQRFAQSKVNFGNAMLQLHGVA